MNKDGFIRAVECTLTAVVIVMMLHGLYLLYGWIVKVLGDWWILVFVLIWYLIVNHTLGVAEDSL